MSKGAAEGPKGPPRFLICRCGEAFKLDGPVHVCLSIEKRMKLFPPIRKGSTITGLYERWIHPVSRRETDSELRRLGCDPAFRPGADQYTIDEE